MNNSISSPAANSSSDPGARHSNEGQKDSALQENPSIIHDPKLDADFSRPPEPSSKLNSTKNTDWLPRFTDREEEFEYNH